MNQGRSVSVRDMSPDEYRDRAEHFREAAADAAVTNFQRWHLETVERSYRTLAESRRPHALPSRRPRH
jgi:hypothetical protein